MIYKATRWTIILVSINYFRKAITDVNQVISKTYRGVRGVLIEQACETQAR